MKALLLIVVMSLARTNLYASSSLDNEDLMYSSITHKGREVAYEKRGTPTKAREFKYKKPKTKKIR